MNTKQIHQSNNHRSSTAKLVYCPHYSKFLTNSKPILKDRVKSHLEERENALFLAATEAISKINDICKKTTSQKHIPQYSQTLINNNKVIELINSLIDEWEGPIYGNRLIKELNGNEVNVEIIGEKKFRDRAINWMQQTSHRITGPFFAQHLMNFKQHLIKHCSLNVIQYGCLEFVVELFQQEIKLYRSGRKPLIRYTTLRDNIDIQNAFKKIHSSLDVIELKNMIKTKHKKLGKQSTKLTAQVFTQQFKELCNELLNKEKFNIYVLKSETSDRTFGYNGNRGVSFSTKNYRFNPSNCMYGQKTNGNINLPKINGIKLESIQSNNNGRVNSFSFMNTTCTCSACHKPININTDLCNRCQRFLNEMNKMEYDAVISLLNRSVPYAKSLAARFCFGRI
eukprot:533559_1